ncbi:MAG TPA: PfkB family carbohydrate kinase, partial [Candidatus Limnocylindrales bacterium]
VRHARPGPSALIARSDFVGVSRDDLDGDVHLDALCRLMRPGALLALTQGEEGGLVMVASRDGAMAMRRYPAIESAGIVDPTGAGDVFLAALLAAHAEPRLVGGRLARGFDLLLAAAVASLVLEAPGLHGVPDRMAVRRRLAEGAARAAARTDPSG